MRSTPPDYLAVRRGGELIGYCCVGAEARVPGWAYDAAAVDVGFGMRPALMGRGLGRAFVGAILAELAPDRPARLTVLEWNARAIHLYEALGFRTIARFVSPRGQRFRVMLR